MKLVCLLTFVVPLTLSALTTSPRPRARDFGIPLEGTPGRWNAITDVPGVEVGQISVTRGEGKKGEMQTARTGVTVVFPRGKGSMAGAPGAWATLNANGEITGVSWLEESGMMEGPIAMTNTQSVGVVRDALVEWVYKKFPEGEEGLLPIVAETDDSWLNQLYAFHIKKEHVFSAANQAKSGPVAEGAVGAGTGTVAFAFKAGIGTASRKIEGGHTLGVIVQANFGKRWDLTVAGVPVGKALEREKLPIENPLPRREGSIVVILGTDAPFLPHQMKRIMKRVSLGMGRTGGLGRNSSGDFFVGFSTASPKRGKSGREVWEAIPNGEIDAFFSAAVSATEEAILNSLFAATDSKGINGNQFFALPLDRLREIMGGRLPARAPNT